LRKQLLTIAVLFIACANTAATSTLALAQVSSPPANDQALADSVFGVFVALRTVAVSNEADDPRFYAREWLEDAIRSAMHARSIPPEPGLDWVADSRMTRLSVSYGVNSVYAYSAVPSGPSRVALTMRTTGCRSHPAVITLTFVLENSDWRIAQARFDSTPKSNTWFLPDLKPIREFAPLAHRDRSRYFNESPLGKSLGLQVKDHPCTE
jgi:hypothetical protein